MTMFGLTIEKLFVVALLAAVIIGPRRLPDYASGLARFVRGLAARASDAARQAERESGVADLREDWTTLDPRQYDPRRIIREAWAASESTEAGGGILGAEEPDAAARRSTDAASGAGKVGGEWVMAGSSGHPRRVWVPGE